MRAVVDTNILVRALIMPQGTVGPVLLRLRRDEYTLLYAQPLLEELIDVLNRPRIRHKYSLTEDDIQTVVSLILLRGEAVAPEERITACRDPRDDKFLEVAVTGKADVIVSGDQDLLVLNPFAGIPILPPAGFFQMLDAETQ
ncbi:MAG: putative toxin-antitoxin system toxin component, PIN family [Chloroflexi bacterium]|nr:putative toxin-antitoxin system toxin component, PIN family [Chloroflexota bacterium]